MKKHDAVEVMALLLREHELRTRFANDRKKVISEMGVNPEDQGFLLSLNLEQLESQAKSLVIKRRAEVLRFTPNTWSRLGTNAKSSFQQYVDNSSWPRGYRRHLFDALCFCQFLKDRNQVGYVRSEHHWLSFLATNRCFSLCFANDLIIHEVEWYGIQYCVRSKGVAHRGALRLKRRKRPTDWMRV
ncbi:MAG: hypothetical protein GY924_25795 [Planctomycetaceae bacterium]|nr:hypothetical protein [Planctomycetaceae bacterium]